jgi:AcrR family transcriptional regulator
MSTRVPDAADVTEPDASDSPRWKRLEPDERRQQILACAVRLFGERPYADVSTTDIAREAGVTRGLINHYFSTKKDLYLEVVRTMATIPEVAVASLPVGDLPTRVHASVTWFLDTVSRHARPWLATVGAEGVGRDPDVEHVLAEADEVVADRVLTAVGLDDVVEHREELRAMIRAYGMLARAAAREWLERGALTRDDAHDLCSTALLVMVEQVFPRVRQATLARR